MSHYGRGELTAVMGPEQVRATLTDVWHPFPPAADRQAWAVVADRQGRELLARAEAAVASPWPALPATLVLEYARTGNRTRGETVHFGRRALLRDLVLGACVSDDGRFLDPVVDAVWALCEETFWGVPAHSGATPGPVTALPVEHEPVIDLFAAETGTLLALTVELLGDRLERLAPGLTARVRREIDRRLLTPYLARDDWHWMARDADEAANWTTWVCSNLIACTLLTETDPDRRGRLVSRAIASLDVFVASMPIDGGCAEGQSYWSRAAGSLFDALDALHQASDGALDGFTLPRVRAATRYLPGLHVAGNTFVQHADGHIRFLGEPVTLYRFGRRVGDAEAQQLALHLRDVPSSQRDASGPGLWRQLQALFDHDFLIRPSTAAPAVSLRWFDRLQVLAAREHPGRTDGLLLVAKGGHNAEPHNHNDVGSFSVTLDGQVLVVDPGVEAYTGATFGPDRYQLWPMRSDWHNLPVVNGHAQRPGADAAASDVRAGTEGPQITWSAELSRAWPEAARLQRWRRTLTLDRELRRVVLDDEWTARELTSLQLPLTLAAEPVPHPDGHLVRIGEQGLRIEHPELRVEVERHPLTDPWLREVWGPALWRLLLTPVDPRPTGSWRVVLSVDGDR